MQQQQQQLQLQQQDDGDTLTVGCVGGRAPRLLSSTLSGFRWARTAARPTWTRLCGYTLGTYTCRFGAGSDWHKEEAGVEVSGQQCMETRWHRQHFQQQTVVELSGQRTDSTASFDSAAGAAGCAVLLWCLRLTYYHQPSIWRASRMAYRTGRKDRSYC